MKIAQLKELRANLYTAQDKIKKDPERPDHPGIHLYRKYCNRKSQKPLVSGHLFRTWLCCKGPGREYLKESYDL